MLLLVTRAACRAGAVMHADANGGCGGDPGALACGASSFMAGWHRMWLLLCSRGVCWMDGWCFSPVSRQVPQLVVGLTIGRHARGPPPGE